MLLHSDSITLFSRVRGARGHADTWVRHVLAGVKVEAKTAMTPGATGDVPGHYVLLLVPKASIGALTYATPEVYQAADDRSGMITFQPGDYFCRGRARLGGIRCAVQSHGVPPHHILRVVPADCTL